MKISFFINSYQVNLNAISKMFFKKNNKANSLSNYYILYTHNQAAQFQTVLAAIPYPRHSRPLKFPTYNEIFQGLNLIHKFSKTKVRYLINEHIMNNCNKDGLFCSTFLGSTHSVLKYLSIKFLESYLSHIQKQPFRCALRKRCS